MTAIRTFWFVLAAASVCADGVAAECVRADIDSGRQIFESTAFSIDGKTSCATCHDPARYFTSDHAVAIGVAGALGTRNAPSLVNVTDNTLFFWDGRRARLDDAVLDAFTNPVELGLASQAVLREKLRHFDAHETPSEVSRRLTCFLRSLASHHSRFDQYLAGSQTLTAQELRGLKLFRDTAGCAICHRIDDKAVSFTDNASHHSGVQQKALEQKMGAIAADVVEQNLPSDAMGAKILTDALWSAAGRFVVTHEPRDMGSFKTPSLRNVAMTAPYMHDGSVATLKDAVDREIYYRAFSTQHAVNLTEQEREAIVAFLTTLTDANYAR